MKTKRVDVAVAIALVVLTWVLYRKAVRLWWTYDDANLLHLVIEHRFRSFFFDRALWPQRLYTPLLSVAFKTLLVAFGLTPARWYVVDLATFAAAAVAIYAAMRMAFDVIASAVAALLFIAAVPLCSLTTELSVIHYPMSIVLGALATVLFMKAVRDELRWLALGSAVLYFLAMLAKEIIVPLPLLLLALPEREWRKRARYAIGHIVAVMAYLGLRRATIGTFLGGYGWAIGPAEWPRLLISIPGKIILASAGAGVGVGVTLMAILAIGVVFALRSKRGCILFLAALAMAVGPIIPVSKEMQQRYALMPWLCWSIAFVAGARSLGDRKRAALFGAASLLAIAANRQEWSHEFGRSRRMSNEARFFMDMAPDGLLRNPLVPPAAMGELNWLKTVHLRKPAGASWFYDDFYFCAVGAREKRVWEYDLARRQVVEITPAVPVLTLRYCQSIRGNASLSAEFHHRDRALFWKFGPYPDGAYRVLLANGIQAFDVPRQDGFRLGDLPGISLRLRYASPAGWVTYSPELKLDFVHHPDSTWQR